jgi:hypothetical protein
MPDQFVLKFYKILRCAGDHTAGAEMYVAFSFDDIYHPYIAAGIGCNNPFSLYEVGLDEAVFSHRRSPIAIHLS